MNQKKCIAASVVGLSLILVSLTAGAQNAVRGKQLYEAQIVPGYLTCGSPGTCHGPNPLDDLNNVRRGTSGPVILAAITNVPLMGPFSGRVSAADAADMAAYISNPAAASSPAITLSATALAFGSTQVATTNSSPMPASVTVTNSGGGALTITGIAKTGANASEFNAAGSCVSAAPVTLAPAATCTLAATFTPTATGTRAATFTFQSNAAANPSVTLSGSGSVQPVPSVALNRNTITFATQTVGASSVAQQIALTNSGSGALTVTQVAATPSAEFVVTSNCVGTIAVGAGCTINVSFAPAGAGTRSGSLTITSNAGGSPHAVALAGLAVTSATGIATAARNNVQFPPTVIGAAMPLESTTITNIGNAPLQIASVAISGAHASEFRLAAANTCVPAANVAPNASCRLDVEFQPQSAGPKSANVVVSHNGPGGSTSLDVSGTAAASQLSSSAMAPSNIGGGAALPLWLVALLAVLLPVAVRSGRTKE